MFRIVLLEPEIPQNTGNIARLCAVTGIELLLVGRLGFSMDDKYLKRAGMDYWNYVKWLHIKTMDEYFDSKPLFYAISTKGITPYTELKVNNNDKIDIVFGSESSGLPSFLYNTEYSDYLYRIPMRSEFRSLNLSSSVAIVSYYLLQQVNFPNLI